MAFRKVTQEFAADRAENSAIHALQQAVRAEDSKLGVFASLM